MNNNSFPHRGNNRVLVLMALLSCVSSMNLPVFPPWRHQQSTCSFSLWKRMWWQPGTCEVGGGVARKPSKASGLGETMTQFYQLCLWRWSSERDWPRQVCWVGSTRGLLPASRLIEKWPLLLCSKNGVSWEWPGWLMCWCFGKAQQPIFKMTEWLRFTDSLILHVCPDI